MNDTAERAFYEAERISTARDRFRKIANELGLPSSCDPIAGESSEAYRQRLLTRLKGYTTFDKAPISKIRGRELDPIEDEILKQAQAHADKRVIKEGKLLMTETRDESGRVVRTPSNDSDPSVWMSSFQNGAVYRGKILDDKYR